MIVGWRGVGIQIHVADDLGHALLSHLPPFFERGGEAVAQATLRTYDGQVQLSLPDDLGVSGPLGPETLRACASRIELCLADRLPDLVTVHAGVVAIGGQAVILPGTSMAGKSTLVRELVGHGATYLSDEFALLTPNGMVCAYPRAMTIRTVAGSDRMVPGSARGFDEPPIRAGLVAFLSYSVDGWQVRPMSQVDAMLRLVANGVSVRREPQLAMTAFGALVERAAAIGGTRGEASDACGHLRLLMSSDSRKR